MLLSLKVKDFGIIADIQWRPRPGLNVITGETGAGKSLVIEAVESLLTGKLDEDVIRTGAEEAHIEGVFALPPDLFTAQVKTLLADKGISLADESIIVSCELRKQGRSVIRINGNAVPRGTLQQITRYLVDVYGQSEHMSLLNRKYHLDFLDAFARNTALRQKFSAGVSELGKAQQELRSLVESEREITRRREFLSFQINEIRKASLREGEQEELESERIRLASCEKLKSLSYEIYRLLYGGDSSHNDSSAAGRLTEVLGLMKKLVDTDPSLQSHLDYLVDTSYGLEETVRALRSYNDSLEYDPLRLEEVESRLELIRSLQRKFGQTTTEVLDYLQQGEKELDSLVHTSERRTELEKICAGLSREMGEVAAGLSDSRRKAARELVTAVKKELGDLQMEQVDFDVAFMQTETGEGLPLPDGKSYAFTGDGVDTVEFMVATNAGEPLKPLAKIASTGELSRFMLALKGALSAADNTPVLIFDEIDIGVGGRSGETIGKKLWLLSRGRQVFCITHLPQIAVFADVHCRVQKGIQDKRALSTLEQLEDKARTAEVAMMLAGPQFTDTSFKDAREMLQKATRWKKTPTGIKQ